MDWVVYELKPWIDRNYRTWPFREATAIAGYSMGGMMSLFSVLRYNSFFSKAAVISPALLPAMEDSKWEIWNGKFSQDTRIFFSRGTAEDSPEGVWHLEYLVQQKGLQTYLFRQEGGVHNESSWVLNFEREKFIDGDNRYAWKIRRTFDGGFAKKGMELARQRQEEADV